MFHWPEVLLRRLRGHFSRSRWLIRLLQLPVREAPTDRPGLILIQIDALSREQLEAALAAGRMPFLKQLLDTQHYRLRTHYAGMPCCTPAVQGELFYGVRGCVPAFSYYDRRAGRTVTLYQPDAAAAVESTLDEAGPGLFQGGSCYSNIFTGAADEPHFCIADMQLKRLFRRGRPVTFLIAVLLHPFSLLRAGALLAVETILALVDCGRGLIAGRDLWKELKFVPSRVAVCILLREIIVIASKMDMARRLPIIQLNLMGYHEQSHRRGATSRFAHWTLKGIDDAIKRIWTNAHRADRHYDLWIYSDHGQVDTTPYTSAMGEPVRQTVRRALAPEAAGPGGGPVQKNRPGLLNRLGFGLAAAADRLVNPTDDPIAVTTLGPCAHVYLDAKNRADRAGCAEKLIHTGKIPMVMIPEKQGETLTVRILTRQRDYRLPQPGDASFFDNHFVPPPVMEDFISACHHPDAGDLILSGDQGPGQPYYSFAQENGSHGGIREAEYAGFWLGPASCPVTGTDDWVRPTDIRRGVLEVLGRPAAEPIGPPVQQRLPQDRPVRVMTYNVHSCVGMDGKRSPLRIAKVIEQFDPDIVALQELDVGRRRSDHADQARIIADILKMDHFFAPAVALEEEQYGDAILSRFPMRLRKADILPGHTARPGHEPRGALWVTVETPGGSLDVLTTHLGLTRRERRLQIQSLLGVDWLGAAAIQDRVVFCGDLNFDPRSRLYRCCTRRLQAAVPHRGPMGTYCGRYPMLRLDHLFYRGGLILQSCRTGDTALARIASDHRPVIAAWMFRTP